jgi:SET family sugar efflux transporter-like MFS transporter
MSKARLFLQVPEFPVLLAANVILGLSYAFALPFMSLFGTRELGLTPAGFGLFMTANAVSGIVLGTWMARLSDTRLSRKAVMMVSTSFSVAGYVAYAYIRDVRILLPVSCILLGLGGGAFSQVFALVRDLLGRHAVPAQDAPFYVNVFRLCFALAWTVGPALGALLLERHSFRASFLAVAGLLCLFIAIVGIGLGRIPAPPPAPAPSKSGAKSPLWTLHRIPGFLPHFVAFALVLSCSTMGMMNLPLLIVESLRGQPGQVGWAYSIAPVFELPFMWFIGLWATRTPPVRIIRYAVALAVAYYAGLSLAAEPWHVYPLQVLSAAIVAVTSGIAITFFQDFLPGQAGTSTDLYGTAGRIGSLAGFLLCGWLGNALGHRSVFAACAVLCAAALAILLRWRPRPA